MEEQIFCKMPFSNRNNITLVTEPVNIAEILIITLVTAL